MLYCFLDTNIFIHYQNIKDIDWNAELGESKVCLVIAPVVFEELDQFKDDHRNSRKRDRARKAIKLMESTLNSTDLTVREGVSLAYADELSHSDFGVNNLSPNNKDDRLVACAIRWSHKHSDDELTLVSHDSGPRRKAKRLGLAAKELSQKYRLPDQLDPRDKEIRELKNEVLKFQNTQPKLQLGFANSNGKIDKLLRAKVQSPKDSIIERLTRRTLTRFLTRRTFQNQYVALMLTLQNSGDAIAAGVEISLRLCSQIEVRQIAPANAPVRLARSLYLVLMGVSSSPRARARAIAAQYGRWKVSSVEPNLKVLRFRVEKVKPHDSVELDPIYIVMAAQHSALENTSIEYDIVKDSPGPRQDGDLHVIINQNSP